MSNPQGQTPPNPQSTTASLLKPSNPRPPSPPTPLHLSLSPATVPLTPSPPTYSPDTAPAARHERHCESSSVVLAPADKPASHLLLLPEFGMNSSSSHPAFTRAEQCECSFGVIIPCLRLCKRVLVRYGGRTEPC